MKHLRKLWIFAVIAVMSVTLVACNNGDNDGDKEPDTALTAPRNVIANVDNRSLTWGAVEGAVGYDIYIRTGSTSDEFVKTTLPRATTTSADWSALLTGGSPIERTPTRHWFAVRAIADPTEFWNSPLSSASNPVQVSLEEFKAPENIEISEADPFTIEWDVVPSAAKYEVRVTQTFPGPSTIVAELTVAGDDITEIKHECCEVICPDESTQGHECCEAECELEDAVLRRFVSIDLWTEDFQVVAGRTYRVAVRAFKAGAVTGVDAPSPWAPGPSGNPGIVLDLTTLPHLAQPARPTVSGMDIKWNRNNDAEAYYINVVGMPDSIELRVDGQALPEGLTSTDTNTTFTYNLALLRLPTAATPYQVTVTSRARGMYDSDPSLPASVTATKHDAAPEITSGENDMKLTWDRGAVTPLDEKPLNRHRIEYRLATATNWVKGPDVLLTSNNEFELSTLGLVGGVYHVRVVAVFKHEDCTLVCEDEGALGHDCDEDCTLVCVDEECEVEVRSAHIDVNIIQLINEPTFIQITAGGMLTWTHTADATLGYALYVNGGRVHASVANTPQWFTVSGSQRRFDLTSLNLTGATGQGTDYKIQLRSLGANPQIHSELTVDRFIAFSSQDVSVPTAVGITDTTLNWTHHASATAGYELWVNGVRVRAGTTWFTSSGTTRSFNLAPLNLQTGDDVQLRSLTENAFVRSDLTEAEKFPAA